MLSNLDSKEEFMLSFFL